MKFPVDEGPNWEHFWSALRTSDGQQFPRDFAHSVRSKNKKENTMDGELIGLAAVIMIFGFPLAGLYTYYRVRKLRTEERLAAIARGVEIPMAAELSQAARSRRSGVLLVTGALGYMLAFGLISFIEREPEVWTAAAFGIIPLAVGIGYFLDATLIRHDAQA